MEVEVGLLTMLSTFGWTSRIPAVDLIRAHLLHHAVNSGPRPEVNARLFMSVRINAFEFPGGQQVYVQTDGVPESCLDVITSVVFYSLTIPILPAFRSLPSSPLTKLMRRGFGTYF